MLGWSTSKHHFRTRKDPRPLVRLLGGALNRRKVVAWVARLTKQIRAIDHPDARLVDRGNTRYQLRLKG